MILAFYLGLVIGACIGLLTLALLKAADKSMQVPHRLSKEEVTDEVISQAIKDADERERWG